MTQEFIQLYYSSYSEHAKTKPANLDRMAAYPSTRNDSPANSSKHFPTLDEEVRLYTNTIDREKYENLADLYAIIVTMEHLEKAYIKDSIKHTEMTSYTPACSKLIAQYKTALNLVSDHVPDIEKFMKEYKLGCPAAANRFKIGVPATIEHSTGAGHGSGASAKYVAETVTVGYAVVKLAHFITLMDTLKLEMKAVDQIHPVLSDLMQSLNNVSSLPADFEGKAKVRQWLITLNSMKAIDEINEEQVRQLQFDMENSYNAFYRSLSKS
ncbi:415_t:CDS:2 [Paraglomus occultum]|uniref:Vacuolar protein sorting-associated protein 28 n=1 Tax=Paraglomus occultum TaxID=144539 RepID=A0A9N9FJY8_9GLOM|nr:415_t:CDS:2 [Paraglomus occultum]